MKLILWTAFALGLLLMSCSATMIVTATAPTHENSGTCLVPVLLPFGPSHPVTMHFAWSGPVSGEYSVQTIGGQVVTFSRQVPSGVYQIRGWASDTGGTSCDTTITRSFTSPPAKPNLQ